MLHIRQKNSSLEDNKSYTVVLPIIGIELDQHPSIIEFPALFELVNAEIPSDAQFLKYQ